MAFHDLGRLAGRPGARRPAFVGAVFIGTFLAAAIAGPARAKVVKFPESHPAVALDVPDGWTVNYSSVGLELRSPEKNSMIVANFFKHDKPAAEAWPKLAARAMEEAGVTIEKTEQPATASSASTIPSNPSSSAAVKPGSKLPSTLPALSAPPGDHFTFSGSPAVNMPGGIAPVVGTTASIASVTLGEAPVGSTVRNKIPHKIVNYRGGSFDGKPTDVQLYIFSLTSDELLLIQQQSGGTDNRAVDIVYSVKSLSAAH